MELWLKPLAETDKAEVFALMNKYGFRVDEHDGVQPQEGSDFGILDDRFIRLYTVFPGRFCMVTEAESGLLGNFAR